MNPFDTLTEYPILHIFKYLNRDELLNLTEVDKKFNRIISESSKTMEKIPMILDFKKRIAISDVIDLTRKRRITALCLMNSNLITAADLSHLLKHLSASVEHLEMCGNSRLSENLFRKLIQIFLPKLKTCIICEMLPKKKSSVKSKINNIVQSTPNRSLTSLSLDSDEMLKFFAGCQNLKSFIFWGECRDTYLYDFLAQQNHLKELQITCSPAATIKVDLSRINCLNLRELSLPAAAEHTASEFLLKQQLHLTKLEILISDQSFLHPIMTSICNAPKLDELDINIRCRPPAISSLPRLENRTVKRLKIIESSRALGWLLQIFRGVDCVELFHCRSNIHDLEMISVNLHDFSGVPHETIDKIRFMAAMKSYHIKFSPAAIPVDVKSFESAVTKFVEKFSTSIGEITIGHKNWRNQGDSKLSNSFCKGLVNRLPKLTKLELYNIASRGNFLSFLDNNRKSLKNLQEVKLHMLREDGPESKKMKIEAD